MQILPQDNSVLYTTIPSLKPYIGFIQQNAVGILSNIITKSSYIPYIGCVLDHILHNDTLTDQQKLFYLLADSLSLISSKNNTLHRSVALSSSSWARTLNCSKSEIFSMQKNMDEKGYFIILRDKNRFGKNKRNVICPTLPDEVFEQLVESPNRFKVSKDKLSSPNALTNKRAYLDQTKLFVKINYQLLNIIIADPQLALLAKILWLDLYLKYYKRQIKNNPLYKADDNFSFVVCYSELQKSLNCSKASLSKAMNQLAELGFLTKQRFHVEASLILTYATNLYTMSSTLFQSLCHDSLRSAALICKTL